MSYRLNKTDGTLLTELIDGKIDNTSTDLTFIGKNYSGFGEFLNENFIKLLENFANVSAPSKPIKGQLWFDSTVDRVKVYDGTTFRSTDSSVISATAPLEKVEGDIWIDSTTNQVYFWDGQSWILIGPNYTKTQGLSGIKVDTVKDLFGLNKVIVYIYVGGTPLIIIAREAFTPAIEITGFSTLRMGMNVNSAFSTFVLDGIADKALAITDELGTEFRINDFVSATDTAGDTMAGKLRIANDQGIVIGADSDYNLLISGGVVTHSNTITDVDYEIKMKDSTAPYTAQYFDASTRKIGFFTQTPAYDLDVTGNQRITGDLRIEGDLTVGTLVNESVTSLRVADKNIQLAIPDDSSLLDSSSEFVDDAGLLIETTGGSIKWTYRTATTAWTTEDNINIDNADGGLLLEGNVLIDKTSIASTVTSAPGLVNIGSLESLTIDNINIDSNRITNSSAGIELSSNGPIEVVGTAQEIKGVKTPISARAVTENPLLTESDNDAVATKQYVDVELGSKPYVFGLDVTGLTITASTNSADNNDVKGILQALVNATTVPNQTLAYIHASAIAASGTDTADVNAQLSKSFIAVDSGGTQNVSVVQDVSATAVPINVTFNITRYTMRFKVIAGVWTHQETTVYTP